MYEGADRDMVKSEILNLDKAFTELTEVTNRLMKVTDNEEFKKFYQSESERLEEAIVSTKQAVYQHLSTHSQK